MLSAVYDAECYYAKCHYAECYGVGGEYLFFDKQIM